MKRTANILLLTFFTFLSYFVWAQKEKKEDKSKDKNVAAKPKYEQVYSYLGKSDFKGGPIAKRIFDSLVKQGICAKDEKGHIYPVTEFNFTYGEKNLYEDSIGNLKVMTDYLLEKCIGDSVTTAIANSMAERSKDGDTVYYDKIIVTRPDNTTTIAKPMKFAITR